VQGPGRARTRGHLARRPSRPWRRRAPQRDWSLRRRAIRGGVSES